jgi:hypothetical protein
MAIVNNSETQITSSYTVEFQAESDSYTPYDYPESYVQIDIYDVNDNLYYTVTNLPQATPWAYTFNSNDVGQYSVVYKVFSGDPGDILDPDESSIIQFEVLEFKPTFNIPIPSCAELGKTFNFHPISWNQNENDLCPVTPGDREITYQRYEFNLNTSTYELKDTDTYTITEEAVVSTPGDYAYQGGAWIPNKLAMVKFVVTVSNCSTSVEKAVVFPICGSWKIRRLTCGDYRFYNYLNSNIQYSLYKGVDPATSTLVKSDTVPAFTFISLPITGDEKDDGIYKIVCNNITQYIFNYCSIENCVLELQKKVLLDANLCDECKLDKVLYQKALRLIPVYETWKKILDKDWVYDVQYQSTDINEGLQALYDAEELYAELKSLCADCGDSTYKKCGCK